MIMSMIKKIKKMNLNLWIINIYIDNQVIIQSSAKSDIQFDQYFLQWIVKEMNSLHDLNIQIQIYWISVHIKMSDNKVADKAVKVTILKSKNTESEESLWHLIVLYKTQIWWWIVKKWINK